MLNLLLAPTLALSPLALCLAGPSVQDPVQDPAYWSRVAVALGERHRVAQTLPEPEADRLLREHLAGLVVPSYAPGAELEELEAVLAPLRVQHGVPVVVEAAAQNRVYGEGLTLTLDLSQPLSAQRVLDLVAETVGLGVGWTVRNGAVVFGLEHDLHPDPQPFLHPIGDLLGLVSRDDLAMLVMEAVAPASWEWDRVAMEPTSGFLLVTQGRQVQLEIEAFLGDLRSFLASMDGAPDLTARPADVRYRRDLARLEAITLAVELQDTPLQDLAGFLSETTGFNVLVTPDVWDELDEEALTFNLSLGRTDARSLLDHVTGPRSGLAWSLRGGVVLLHQPYELPGDQSLSFYDVQAIISPAPARFAAAPAGDRLEPLLLSANLLEDLIRNHIEPESWDRDPGNTLRIAESGILYLRQSPRVHGQVRALLVDLHGVAATLLAEQGR